MSNNNEEDQQVLDHDLIVEADPILINWIKSTIVKHALVGSNEQLDSLWTEQHTKNVSVFFGQDSTLYLFVTTHNISTNATENHDTQQQTTETTMFNVTLKPLSKFDTILYFIKDTSKIISAENLDQTISLGTIHGNPLDSLLDIVKDQFTPNLLNAKTPWPDSIKKEFSGHMHKFLASLTETTYKMKGSTVLYVPLETIPNIKEARKQKDLVQRLEAALVHWTTQIKEVLYEKDPVEHSENSRPLSEIEYWRMRAKDLMNIKKQIQRDDVRNIVEILSNSSFLTTFKKVAGEIQQGCDEALENLKFLSTLQAPCERLAVALPKDITVIIPEILQTISMIWQISTTYNTQERLTSLLRKLSNEIIFRSCSTISLDDIFQGNVKSSMNSLNESIHAGIAWKNICIKTFAKLASRYAGKEEQQKNFEYDQSSVFAEVDAFVQRCKDLLEVCEAQIQFGAGSQTNGLPVFGGSKGPSVTKHLLDIRSAFQKLISDLSNLSYPILDVKATKWHDDHGRFKSGVKDLEMIMMHVMNSAFESVNTVEEGVEMLEAFSFLAKRDTIKRNVENKTVEVLNKFVGELEFAEKQFELFKKDPPLQPNYPKLAGAAMWASGWLLRINKHKQIIDAAYFLPRPQVDMDNMKYKYESVKASFEKYIQAKNKEWHEYASSLNAAQLLDKPVLVRGEGKYLDTNFDKVLLNIFQEVRFWQCFSFETPASAQELFLREDKLRINRESVNLVARDYNDIIKCLSPEEHRLFRERIAFLDKKVNLGLTNLYWSSKGMIEYFVTECRKFCKELHSVIDDFKSNVFKIFECCQSVSSTELLKLETKKVYSDAAFEKAQSKHRTVARQALEDLNNSIVSMMTHLYHYFSADPEDIQQEWWAFVQKMEGRIDASLRTTVRKSLQKISVAINGDKKVQDSSVNPLFSVNVVLAPEDNESKPALKPSVKELCEMVDKMTTQLVRVVSVVPKLEGLMRDEVKNNDESNDDKAKKLKQRTNYFDDIKADNEIANLKRVITEGMNRITPEIDAYLLNWDKQYNPIWSVDKDKFIKRFHQPADRPVSSFKNEIDKYKDHQEDVKREQSSKLIGYLQLDCQPIKNTLVLECNSWQIKLLDLLRQIAQKELIRLYQTFETTTKQLSEDPINLDMLGKKLDLLKKSQTDSAKYDQKHQVLVEQYALLDECEANVTSDEQEKLAKLLEKIDEYNKFLAKAKKSLDAHQERFRLKFKNDLDNFGKAAVVMKSDFIAKGPYSSSYSVPQALDVINDYRNKLSSKRNEETKLKTGLKVFNMEMQQYKELKDVTRDLELLEKIWGLRKEWFDSWDKWKLGSFYELELEEMEKEVSNYMRKLNDLGRDIREWSVWSDQKDRLNQFKRIVPLIQDLKNPAMRDRHWRDVQEIVNSKFDHKDKSFNLETIFKLGFESYVNDIATLSHAASQELGIERDLAKIAKTWESMELELVEYRGTYILKSMELISTELEDNNVTLGSMKISQFVVSFASEVNYWEKTLSRISEILEMLLTVQQKWQYLLNIFEVDDIQKQLPEETTIFKVVNSKWRALMQDMFETKIAKKATQKEGLLSMLSEMNQKLDKIQKHLDDYLEVKRMQFPRFYFLSDTDLLEILGQSKDPSAVQKHLDKFFEGICKIKISQSKDVRQAGFVATAMLSKEGESVPFNHQVPLDGPVEKWLGSIESAMRSAVKKNLQKCYTEIARTTNREKWVVDWAGQLGITSSQLLWTKKVEEAFQKAKTSKKNPMKDLRKTYNDYLQKYAEMMRGELTALNRTKLVALITIEVHAKQVIDDLMKTNCTSVDDFEWVKQLRFYWDAEKDDCIVNQTSATIAYDHEYLGNSARLVITPLTERCYMTLTTAIQLRRGGNPQGPAGTGKTETVKDLGKAIAKYVIVFNCSDGLDYKSLGKMFSGLVQTGSWSCFDEFNRIELEVLSVVASQIFNILNAITVGLKSMILEGQEIPLNPTCGIFVTMNPGYAGRSELPDNLKALLRPVAMMVPDATLICEIKLLSQGFASEKCSQLARKITTMYSLLSQQLSKQTHYDFGLRNITAVLLTAGKLKRAAKPDADEEQLLLTACKDMNQPKFVSEDLPLFLAIISDLFPNVEVPEKKLGSLKTAIADCLKSQHLQLHPYIVDKAIQLYETQTTRHGVMVVGSTGSGKTTSWRVLQAAFTKLANDKVEGYLPVIDYIINPKAVSNDELFGNYDKTREWKNGIVSALMKEAVNNTSNSLKWIVFDGPVDTLWIESMNSVLDDNKVLTLINSERITLNHLVSLLFEVQDLAVASPATVSRCGMVFFDESDLGWKPFIETWLIKRKKVEETMKCPNPEAVYQLLQTLITKFLDKALKTKDLAGELISTSPINAVRSCCHLYDSIATSENLDVKDEESYLEISQKLFIFAMIWSIGGVVSEEGRKKMDMLFREFDPQFPGKDSIYEYFYDSKSKEWKSWEEKVNQSWKPNAKVPFHKILVPTIDTVRYSYLISALLQSEKHTLVVGNTGTGKTVLIEHTLSQFDQNKYAAQTINFSARTSSNKLQLMLESKVEKKSFDTYAPYSGKQLIVLVDDFNMPQKDTYGSQPPLELLRQWMDYGFWYDREKQTKKNIKKMQVISAMGPPGGGRTVISARLQSRFNILNVTFPADPQIKRIFGSLLKHRLNTLEELKSIVDPITQATLDMYKLITTELPPIPSKSHYIFNLRDISKVFRGLLKADHESMDNKDQFFKLWVHENYRVFYDRLIDDQDRAWFKQKLSDKLAQAFDIKWTSLFHDDKPALFSELLSDGNYKEVPDMPKLKRELENRLADYNDVGKRQMNLILFNYAIEHVCRIHRILKQPRGHALLVGVGGSGRQSLTRLASFIAEYDVFMIEVTNNYKQQQFHESLVQLFTQAGLKQKKHVFIFSDTQIVEESFLEDINTMLSTGEVPGIFDSEDMTIYEQLKKEAISNGITDTPEDVFKFFMERAKDSIHVVLCMSPVGSMFRSRLRMYPALVSCTTIDWFSEWPNYALKEVALSFLEKVDLGDTSIKESVAELFVFIHSSVIDASAKMIAELKRYNYVTPTNFLELITGYIELLKDKRHLLGEQAAKLQNGLQTLENARIEVQKMSVTLEQKKKEANQMKKETEDLMVIILSEKSVVNDKVQQVDIERQAISKEKEKADKMTQEAQSDLELALPKLREAENALKTLNTKDISEIKNYQKPHKLILLVLQGVMTVCKKKTDWADIQRELANPQRFIDSLIKYKKEEISEGLLSKIHAGYTSKEEFVPSKLADISGAAKGLCSWVVAMEEYGKIYLKVKPKQDKLAAAKLVLEKNSMKLEAAESQLKELQDKVDRLSKTYNEKMDLKTLAVKQKEETEEKLNRAEQLVSGLEGERERWGKSIADFKQAIANLVGDVLLAAAFLSYAGPFNSVYREQLKSTWLKEVTRLKIPVSKEFTFQSFLTSPTEVRNWTLQGLPADSFSIENAALVTRGRRWPLMIDPQNQANKWLKRMAKDKKIIVVDMKKRDLLRILENAIKFGQQVLIQDVPEEIDPALEPIISKAIVKVSNRSIIKIGDREVDYNPEFKLYVTTKLSNPHYPPEISTKMTIVNFAVTKQGLQDQLLGNVVKAERPELEEQKNEIVVNVANDKRRMEELEDEILKLLTTAKGKSLLDDLNLIKTLQASKSTSESIKKQLVVSQETERKIDTARNQYIKAASRASILYFVLTDLGKIDPMYQFSLDTYIDQYESSIKASDRPARQDMVQQRVDMLNEFHTFEVYRTTCQGLFEKDKLLFSFQMCVKIMEDANKLNMEEYNFFLRGGQVLEKESQPPNPFDWLPEQAWDNIFELDKLPSFHGISQSFEEAAAEWHEWYCSATPELEQLPSEWATKGEGWNKMLIVRCVRQDRVNFIIKTFITNEIGEKYVNPPVNDVKSIFTNSSSTTPFIFVLSPGVDPAASLEQLAATEKVKLNSLSLGQGQDRIAQELLAKCRENGEWLYLANCHLMIRWMPVLEEAIESFAENKPQGSFRLWLSSKPHPKFPITILQKSRKITTEPPQGLRSNLLRLYSNITPEQFNKCKKQMEYKRLLFSLAFFHGVLLERIKFGNLGWNIPYDFNDSDFSVSENIVQLYLTKYESQTPWEAMRYLIAEASYGGRVTDDRDRRILDVYINQYFNEQVLVQSEYALASDNRYHTPKDGDMDSYFKFIKEMSADDPPTAFGQHPNADISSQISKATLLLQTLTSLTPQIVSGAAAQDKPETKVAMIASDLLENRIPSIIDKSIAQQAEPSALNTVLLQEIARYNKLLAIVKSSLRDLIKAIKGEVVMSAELEEVFYSLLDQKVPSMWQRVSYPSLKPMASWVRDLIQRVDQFKLWSEGEPPAVFWLSGFTFPSGFLTALKQTTARATNTPVDELTFEFTVMPQYTYAQRPKEGAYVTGFILEGAAWDIDKSCLAEPKPMELKAKMPVIHFKPITKKKSSKDVYSCPVYMYPARAPSFILSVDLKSGHTGPEHWIKRGTAMLLADDA